MTATTEGDGAERGKWRRRGPEGLFRHVAMLDELGRSQPAGVALSYVLHDVVAGLLADESGATVFGRAHPGDLAVKRVGQGYVLDGHVRPLVPGTAADAYCTVVDRWAFVVATTLAGVERGVRYRAVRVPGVRFDERAEAEERLFVACVSTAAAERYLEVAVEHTRRRVSFGTPLQRHQAVRLQLADLRAAVEGCRRLNELGVQALADGGDLRLSTAIAALKACRVVRRAAEDCATVHGAASYVRSHPTAHFLADAHLLGTAAGPEETLLATIADA